MRDDRVLLTASPRCLRRPRRGDGDDGVAESKPAAFEHARAQAAVAAHCVVAARPERVLHARAGVTFGDAFEQRLSDAEAAALERQQRQAGDDDVPAQQRRRHLAVTRERGDCREVFGLDQRDAAVAAAAGVAIADQALAGHRFGVSNLAHRHVAARPQPDPLDAAGTRQVGHQPAERGIVWGQRHAGLRVAPMLACAR